jgi:general secretion pathway protein G
MTLLELMLVIATVAIVAAIAAPSYRAYVLRTHITEATNEIRRIQLVVDRYVANNDGELPPDLAAVDLDALRDPWGHAYVYQPLASGNQGSARKDKNLVPINSDYDLYSVGPDGVSRAPLTAKDSRDDIVRANDGGFVGPATDYA